MTTHTNDSSRLNGTLEPDTDHVERMSYASLLPEDFPDRLERLKEASGLTWSGARRRHRRRLQADVQVAQGHRTLWGSSALPLPVCLPDTRWLANPPGRRVPDDLLQELTGSPRPRSRNGGA